MFNFACRIPHAMLHGFRIHTSGWVASLAVVFSVLASATTTSAQSDKLVASVEGISEFQLENGARVLLYPDSSAGTVTVAVTVMVGSRHEGYGETGMAHLLEHLLFKGSDKHRDIPKEMKDRGATFNGTTWYDRTNYYETVPATDENLEWALDLEADRLVNSFVDGEDLKSEMTVVRNEFEIGENNPDRILFQRIMANSYEWHNYGKSTIGNRIDLERVPIDNLKRFYQKFYQPDNIMLVVAGKFDPDKTLELINKKFGSIPKPTRVLDKTYTEEPPQDGERMVVLRRVGEVAVTAVGYHIPAASHEDYAPIEVLSQILGDEPSGILYKDLVESKIASSASSMEVIGHDPGMLLCFAQVPKGGDPEKTRDALLESTHTAGDKIEASAVQRAIQQLLKNRENLQANTQRFAVELSEWSAYGDWRLFFIQRDRLEKVKLADVQRVAKQYFIPSNQTVGMFLPSTDPKRVTVPSTPNIKTLVSNYKGRSKLSEGEALGTDPASIEGRITRDELSENFSVALLPKKTRGDRVFMQMTLRYGNEEELSKGRRADASSILGTMLNRGTSSMSYQEVEDKLNELKTNLRISGGPGSLSIGIQSRKDTFEDALKIIKDVLRNPTFPESEFDIIKQESLTGLEQQKSDPQALAFNALMRKMNPLDPDDIRYVPTVEESIEKMKAITVEDVRDLYKDFLGATYGELTIVGTFEPEASISIVKDMLSGWETTKPYQRIANPVDGKTKGETIIINTPDKKNAVYAAGLMFEARDDDPDHAALLMGNYILGGGSLSNRLANRVRQKDGLSYMVQSMFIADDQDKRGTFLAIAAANPDNKDKLVSAMRDEMTRLLESGVEDEELQKAKDGYLQNMQRGRTGDAALLQMIHSQHVTNRKMDFVENLEKEIKSVNKDQVNAAIKKMVDLDRLIIITAGDFDKNKNSASDDSNDKKDK